MEASESQAQEAPQESQAPVEPASQESAAPTQPEAPDVGEALSSIQDTLKRWEEQAQDEGQPEGNLAELLYGAEGQELEQPEHGEQPQAQEQQQEMDPVVARLLQLEQHVLSSEEQAQEQKLLQLEEKYPDITDHADEIRSTLEQMDTEAGFELPVTPSLVERIYKAIKADAASASETPAEEANKSGASLETDAGAGAEEREETEEDRIKRAIANAKPPDSVFTRG